MVGPIYLAWSRPIISSARLAFSVLYLSTDHSSPSLSPAKWMARGGESPSAGRNCLLSTPSPPPLRTPHRHPLQCAPRRRRPAAICALLVVVPLARPLAGAVCALHVIIPFGAPLAAADSRDAEATPSGRDITVCLLRAHHLAAWAKLRRQRGAAATCPAAGAWRGHPGTWAPRRSRQRNSVDVPLQCRCAHLAASARICGAQRGRHLRAAGRRRRGATVSSLCPP
ncbi:unnamed protein product [Urochloa humidicola]